LVTSPPVNGVANQESDEWIKTFPSGRKVRYSYQLLIAGFSASAEILEPAAAAITYTHIHADLPGPTNRAQIEAEFVDDLAKVDPTHEAGRKIA